MPDTDRTPVTIKLADTDAQALIIARKAKVAAELAAHVAARKLARAKTGDLATATSLKEAADATQLTKVADFTSGVDAALAKAKVSRADFAAIHHDHATGTLRCQREPDAPGDGVTRINGLPCVERHRVKLTDAQADAHAAAFAIGLAKGYDAAEAGRKVAQYKVDHPELFAGSPGEPPPVDPTYEALKQAQTDAQQAQRDQQIVMAGIEQAALDAAGVQRPTDRSYHYTCESRTGDIVISWPDEPEPTVPAGDTGPGLGEIVP